jgi:methylated-DNA-protein-cysteine methyltransferase-like protein
MATQLRKAAKQDEDARAEVLRRILDAVRAIPRGRVASYGQVAANAGLKGRARLVGFALRHGDGRLPWHRVLRASGQSAFPEGSANRAEQSKRLAREGVRVVRGRVDLGRFGWSRDLDETLWGPVGGVLESTRRRRKSN